MIIPSQETGQQSTHIRREGKGHGLNERIEAPRSGSEALLSLTWRSH